MFAELMMPVVPRNPLFSFPLKRETKSNRKRINEGVQAYNENRLEILISTGEALKSPYFDTLKL